MPCTDCQSLPTYTHTLTVQRPGTTADAAGHVDLTDDDNWDTVGQIRARFVTKGGREAFVFKQTQAETTDVLYTPSTSLSRQLKSNTQWRLKCGSDVYEITYSDEINKAGREVIIEVKEQV